MAKRIFADHGKEPFDLWWLVGVYNYTRIAAQHPEVVLSCFNVTVEDPAKDRGTVVRHDELSSRRGLVNDDFLEQEQRAFILEVVL